MVWGYVLMYFSLTRHHTEGPSPSNLFVEENKVNNINKISFFSRQRMALAGPGQELPRKSIRLNPG